MVARALLALVTFRFSVTFWAATVALFFSLLAPGFRRIERFNQVRYVRRFPRGCVRSEFYRGGRFAVSDPLPPCAFAYGNQWQYWRFCIGVADDLRDA